MLVRKILVIGAMLVLLSACASAPMPVVEADDGETPVVDESSESSGTDDSSEVVVSEQTIMDTLSPGVLKELDLDVDAELALVSFEEVTWNDASMGCPEPDMMYAQVLTPGYLVTYSYEGQTIEVHASSKLSKFVMCDPSEDENVDEDESAASPLPLAELSEHPGVTLALQEMVSKAGVKADEVSLLEVSEEEWPDSCLGCAGKEEMCLSVITSGFRVMLVYGGEVYEFHTNQGESARLCGVTKQ